MGGALSSFTYVIESRTSAISDLFGPATLRCNSVQGHIASRSSANCSLAYPVGMALGSSPLPEHRCDDIAASHRLSLPSDQRIEAGGGCGACCGAAPHQPQPRHDYYI